MAENITLAVRLKLDGKEVVGGINVSREQFRKLAADARHAGDQLAGGFSRASQGVRSISDMLAQARDVMLGFVAVSSVRRAVDGFAELNARIALVETSALDARNAFVSVFAIAQAGGQDLDTVAQVYGRIARNARTLGLDQQAVLQTTQAVANAVRLSGTSAEAARGALLQFGQALASGTLRGDELNSIMEQTPALAEAIARGMGKTVGELRKLGEEGRLTAADVIGAIRSESARLEAEASRMADTIDKSLTRLGNAWQRYLGENAGAAARATSAAINALADNFDKLANTVVAVGAGFAALKFSGWIAGAGGLAAALSRIHPVTAVIGTAVTALGLAFQDFQRKGENAAEGVRAALEKLQSGAARVAADIRGMTVANVNKALGDLERDRTRLAADLDKQRKELNALRERRLDSRKDIARRDRLSAEVLGAEQALESLDKELAGIRANMKDAGKRDIDNYFNTFGDKAEQTRKKLADLRDATQKALKAAAGTIDPAGERARILANEARVKNEILGGGRGERVTNGNKERLALAETLAAQTDRLNTDALQREISSAKTAFEARKISAGEYYQYLTERQQQLEQIEIAALERRRNAAAAEISRAPPGSTDSLRAQAEVAKLNTDIAIAQRKLADFNRDAATALAEAQAARLKDEFEALNKQVEAAFSQLREREQELSDRVSLGAPQAAAEAAINAARRETLATTTALQEQMLALAAANPAVFGAEAQAQIAQYNGRMRDLGVVVDSVATRINSTVSTAFEKLFIDIGSGAATAAEALRGFLRSVVQEIQAVVAQNLSRRILGAIIPQGQAGQTGGLGGFISGLLGGGRIASLVGAALKLFGFASGGYVSGPGTSTSDSIPARLSSGEYVIRAAAVRQYGVSFLDAINGLKRAPRVMGAGSLAFAAGGLVPQAAAAPQMQQAIQIVNSLDPSVTLDHLQSAAGARIILNTISANPRAVRAALGG